jgi:ABC-2 type transport system permease protein
MIATIGLAWRLLWRDRKVPVALGLLFLLAIVAIVLDGVRATAAERDRVAADVLDRGTFQAQGARNPHSVAHFSRFAFRPRAETMVLDPGISDFTGTAVWMEAHWQNPPNARAAEDYLDLGRSSELGLAWIWQVVAPLLLIGLGFDAVARERERRTLAIVMVGGLSLPRFVAAKALAVFSVFALVLIGTAALAALLRSGAPVEDRVARTAMWIGGYLGYLAMWTAITLAVSVRARTSRAALVVLLACWAAIALIAPRIVANLADEQVPIPSSAELRAAIERDLKEGFDGHGSADQRSKALEARVLAEYKVDSVAKLPVSFAGIKLEEGERVGNLVFDKHYGQLAERYARQRSWRRATGGPLAALQHLSTAAAGTDVEHQLEFARQAEQQRRDIVARLNADMVAHGAGKDFDYLADPSLWSRIPAFRYDAPSLDGGVAVDLALLAGWIVAAGGLLAWFVRRAAKELVP